MKKILIIDDTPMTAYFFEHIYFTQVKAQYLQILDPYKAREVIDEFKPGLVILDVKFHLPIDGVELGMFIKKEYGIPIIYHSSCTSQEAMDIIDKIKPLGYMTKAVGNYSEESKLYYYSLVSYAFKDNLE